jgi:DNA-binding transcriptional LysR family regulator
MLIARRPAPPGGAQGAVTYNLRHLRAFLAVAAHRSVTRAAEDCRLSQPAVTQGLAKLERALGTPLFRRTPQGLFPTPIGLLFERRVARAFAHLDAATEATAPRLQLTATAPQLRALIALRDAESYTIAARRLGVAQPTVHRAVKELEQDAPRPLFERTSHGTQATRAGATLADAARLTFAELDQAWTAAAEAQGREVGKIVAGALPLSRSCLLPQAIAAFRRARPRLPVHIRDGAYAELLAGLRRGEIDFIVGALRDPAPAEDVEQTRLFDDALAIVARPGHPALDEAAQDLGALAAYPWVVPAPGSPARTMLELALTARGVAWPASMVETGSLIVMRELLGLSDHLGCVSRLQAEAEIARGLMARIPVVLPETARPIGLATRRGWEPTAAQAEFLAALRAVEPSS